MRVLERVEGTRRALAATIAARAALWAAAAGLATLAFVTALSHRRGDSVGGAAWLAVVGVAGVVLAVLLRPVRRLTVARVALWIEERVPRLQYALVTAVDPAGDLGIVQRNERQPTASIPLRKLPHRGRAESALAVVDHDVGRRAIGRARQRGRFRNRGVVRRCGRGHKSQSTELSGTSNVSITIPQPRSPGSRQIRLFRPRQRRNESYWLLDTTCG